MRLLAFIVFVSVMLLATCSAPELAPALVETEMLSLPLADDHAVASEADGGRSQPRLSEASCGVPNLYQ